MMFGMLLLLSTIYHRTTYCRRNRDLLVYVRYLCKPYKGVPVRRRKRQLEQQEQRERDLSRNWQVAINNHKIYRTPRDNTT